MVVIIARYLPIAAIDYQAIVQVASTQALTLHLHTVVVRVIMVARQAVRQVALAAVHQVVLIRL